MHPRIGGQGDREHDGERSACADRLGARRSCRALLVAPIGVWPALALGLASAGVERFALDAALAAAEAQTSYFGFANCALQRVERFERLARRHLVGIERRERCHQSSERGVAVAVGAGVPRALRRTAASRRSACAPARCGPRDSSCASTSLARSITAAGKPGKLRHLDAVASGRRRPRPPRAGTRLRPAIPSPAWSR